MKPEQRKELLSIMKHNGISELWQTEDGQVFLRKNDAENHSRTADGKKRDKSLKISQVTKEELSASEKAEKQEDKK